MTQPYNSGMSIFFSYFMPTFLDADDFKVRTKEIPTSTFTVKVRICYLFTEFLYLGPFSKC